MTAPVPAGRVRSLHRFPVKSLLGETLRDLHVDGRGCAGDRLWSVRDLDGRFGSGKSTRRFRRIDGLLALSATYDGDTPVIGFPDGRSVRADDSEVHEVLSRHVDRPVRLAREQQVSHFDEGPVHLVTATSLRTLSSAHGREIDERRTRANVVVDGSVDGAIDGADGGGFPEHAWIGRRVHVGEEVELVVTALMPRCVMVNLAQGDVPTDDDVLRSVHRVSAGALGVVADVVRPGVMRRGDPVRVG